MGLKLYVNNKQVWESDGDATLVTSISGSTQKGEFGRLGVANDVDRVDLFIAVRDEIESASDLDVRDALEGRERSNNLEKALKERGDRPNGSNSNIMHNEALEKERFAPVDSDSKDEADSTSPVTSESNEGNSEKKSFSTTSKR